MTEESSGWRPDPGARIAGKVVDIATGDGGYGPYPIVTIVTGAGDEVAVHAFHQVLRTELARRRPKVGTELAITYVGEQPSKDGRGKYHVYRVSGGETQGYDWDQDLPEDQRGGGGASAEPAVPIEPEPVPVAVPAVAGDVSEDDDLPF